MKEPVYSDVFDFENLYQAAKEVLVDKRCFPRELAYNMNLEENLIELQNQLVWFTYYPDEYREFIITDPKTRLISAQCLKDRIVQSALCRVVEPWIDRQFDFDSYACREGKGNLAAANRVSYYIDKPQNTFFFVFDIHHFFDSVVVEKLEEIIEKRYIKDNGILWLFSTFLHYDCASGVGIKKGNRTSQLSGNIYLNELDFFMRHTLKIKQFVRLMDDCIVFSDSRENLLQKWDVIENFLYKELHLTLNEKSYIGKSSDGVTFVGYHIEPGKKIVKKTTLDRTRDYIKAWRSGKIDDVSFYRSMASRIGHFSGTASYKWGCEQLLKILKYALVDRPEKCHKSSKSDGCR